MDAGLGWDDLKISQLFSPAIFNLDWYVMEKKVITSK
jgi:hypothetical protein